MTIIDWVLELRNNINNHGIRFGIFFTLYAVYRKEKRNRMLDQRDEAMFHNQRVIMEHLGVLDQWRGHPKISQTEVESLKKLWRSSLGDISRVELKLRRRKEMNQQINWVSIVTATAGAGKIILQSFGIEIPQEQINEAINGAAAVVTIIGIFMSHRKAVQQNVNVANQLQSNK